MLLLFILCYVETSNNLLDLVSEVIVQFYIDFTSRLLKQIWLFPYPYEFCNPVQIHRMKMIYDMIRYDTIWHDMTWYDMYDMVWYMIWYDMTDMTWHDMYDMIWYDMIWYDMIWYDMIWYDMIW